MPQITYIGQADRIEWCGRRFESGIPIDLDMMKADDRHIMDRAEGNPFFEVVDGVTDAEIIVESPPQPEPVEVDHSERDALRAELDRLGVQYHHRHGVAKLQELLTAVSTVEPDPDYTGEPEDV